MTLETALRIYEMLLPGWREWPRVGQEHIGRVPWREDRHPSLHVNPAKCTWIDRATGEGGGAVDMLRRMRSDDDARAILRALASDDLGLGRDIYPVRRRDEWRPLHPVPADAPPPSFAHAKLGSPSVPPWSYSSATGELLGYVVRFDNPNGAKDFQPHVYAENTTTGERRWLWKGFPRPRPLYRLDRLASRRDALVLVCEGEKAADAAALVLPDCVATTSQHGANSVTGTDWAPLKGRRVVVWPDADKPGELYAEDVRRLASEAGAVSVGVVKLPEGLPDGWDLADALPPGLDNNRVLSLVAEADAAAATSPTPSESAEWPELQPLRGIANLPRLPADLLPRWAGDFASALSIATETPPELAVAAVLGACFVAAARRFIVSVKDGYMEPCNLWLAPALESGSRKSAVMRRATAPIDDWQYERAEAMRSEIAQEASRRATAEARVRALRVKAAKNGDTVAAAEAADLEACFPRVPVSPVVWTSDATPERLGLLLAEHDERMGWISSEAGVFGLLAGRYSNNESSNLDLFLKAHVGDPERVDRVNRPSVYLRQPLLTLVISPQPSVIEALDNTDPSFRGRGLLGRFLYLLPPSGIGYRSLESDPVPDYVAARYALGLRQLLDLEAHRDASGRVVLNRLQLDPVAYAEWLAFARVIEAKMRPGEELAGMRDWGAKLAGNIARVAGVLHAIEHAEADPVAALISTDTMGRALAIGAVLVKHAIAAYELMRPPASRAAERVWRWIEERHLDETDVRAIHRGLHGSDAFRKVEAIESALAELADRAYVRLIHHHPDGPGRPPSASVKVRPTIAEGWR